MIGHSRWGDDARAVAVRRPELVSRTISMGVDLQAMFHCSVPTQAALQAARHALARTARARREECLTYRCQCTFMDDSFAPFPATGSG